jgi:hypothetical protein
MALPTGTERDDAGAERTDDPRRRVAMMRPGTAGRKSWRRVRDWIHWLRHGQEEVEALYGPNPNNISDEERIAQAGVRQLFG